MTIAAQLADAVAEPVLYDVPLTEYTTLKVGGLARFVVTVNTEQELAKVAEVVAVNRCAWTVVGRGSNLLVSDEGFDGVVIVLGKGFRGVVCDGHTVRVGAAEPLPTLANLLADEGLAGFSWGCGVPGTVGGAVRMNAGAHGRDMAANLIEIDVYRMGVRARETWPRDALGLRYRGSELPRDAIVLSATLAFEEGEPDELRAEVAEIRQWRRTHQPLNQPNCGSVFANPDGHEPAAVLIDRAGLKGFTVGGASVSTLHANFIVTRAGARAADVVQLIEAVKDAVKQRFGVLLREEVVMLTTPHVPEPHG